MEAVWSRFSSLLLNRAEDPHSHSTEKARPTVWSSNLDLTFIMFEWFLCVCLFPGCMDIYMYICI